MRLEAHRSRFVRDEEIVCSARKRAAARSDHYGRACHRKARRTQGLENNLVITRNCNRAYDDAYAIEGAKIGDTLRIRLPNRYNVRTGAALSAQAYTEQRTSLAVSNQVGVDLNFTTAELTLSIDDFAERILKPALSQVASYIDNDVASGYKQMYASVGTPGTTPSTSLVLSSSGATRRAGRFPPGALSRRASGQSLPRSAGRLTASMSRK